MRFPVYVTTPGAHLSYVNGRLQVKYPEPESKVVDLPIRKISSIFLYGPSSYTPHFLEISLRLHISHQIFSSSGRYIGTISKGYLQNASINQAVWQVRDNLSSRNRIAGWILAEKLSAMRKLLTSAPPNKFFHV